MKFLIVFLGVFAAANAVSLFDVFKEEWHAFKGEHRKLYNDNTEDQYRMKIFMDNMHKVATHNQLYASGKVSYKLKLNKFGDLLHHEFVVINGYNKTGLLNGIQKQSYGEKQRANDAATYIPAANTAVPKTVDWRESGAVTGVKDQGHCGSCWSFSATGSLEGQHFRKTGTLVSLSEQNLVDCSATYGNNGCNGGLMDYAFKYIHENGGIDTEKTYPYEGVDSTCRYVAKNSGATDKGFMDIKQGSEKDLQHALASVGPISIAIDASQQSFQFYSEGVYYDENCSSEDLDHGVLVVGYGTTEDNIDYWLVKNSWGTTWGDGGYIKIARNKDNHCGVATSASYPIV